MFARSVSINLKPNSVGEFSRTIDRQILPLLRKQKGFQDEIMFIAPGGLEAIGISLWDKQESAENYEHKTYPVVLKSLESLVEGNPRILNYQVSNSTFHKIDVPVGD